MKKRWFVVILTIGLLLSVLPLSALALSPDPTITDSDGTIIGWEDLSTVSDFLDDSQEQKLAVADAQSGTAAVSGLSETGSGKSLADADNDEAADGLSAVNSPPPYTLSLDEEQGDEEQEDATPADGTGGTGGTGSTGGTGGTTDKCKIGSTGYATLQSAINAATEGDQIDLLQNITETGGLTFDGKTLTISGGGTRTLTLENVGMYATNGSKITFKDLTLTINAHTNPSPSGSGATANLITNSDLTMNNVLFTLTPGDSSVSGSGSGIYLYRYSNLYLNGTIAEIHGFNGIECSGIFADESELAHGEKRKIELVGSTLTVTDCGWNGMTINPVDLDLTNSHVYLKHNAKGGLGCYYGKLTMEGSTLTADENGNSWGLFVKQLDMDGSSTLNACNNGSNGIVIGGRGVIQKGAKLNCNSNGYIGLYVFLDPTNGWYGDVVIEPGATVTARGNAFSGVHNSNKLEIEGTVIADSNKLFGITNDAGDDVDDELIITNNAEVSARQNLVFGIFNYDNAKLTVKSGADLKVEENTGSGILNGRNATLNLNAGSIQRNNARYGINDGYVTQGGGIQNWGTAILSDDVALYNNHATSAGDDIYNADGATITFGDTGKGWTLDGGPDCYDDIDGWYDDSKNARWNAHAEDEADLHTVLVDSGTFNSVLALKAAHGTGTLIISKEISGALEPDDCGTEFNFVLTLADTSITTVDAKKYGVVFEDGKAAFTLKDGESITIANLPSGMSYTLAEQSKGGWRLARVDGDAEGVVPRRTTAAITFINEKLPSTGSLVISKEILGDLIAEDADTEFHFVLTLDDDSITTADAKEYGVVFEDGKAAFTLKGDESITIANLPAGVGYTLAEQSKGGWRLAWVDGDAEGVVPLRTTAAITFVNEKLSSTGSLVISKEILGDLTAEDADTEFYFMLTLDDGSITTADAKEYGVVFENGWATFTLKGGESITIANLPTGVGYTLIETRQKGWTLQSVSGETTGVIPQNDTAEITFVNQKDDSFVPVDPVDPAAPVTPEVPETPAQDEVPETPAQDEVSETPAQDEAPALPQTPEAPAKADASVSTLPQTGTTDWLAVVLLLSGFGLLGCGWFFDRKQRAAKH